ncbi:DUF3800 domain-containing protein [Pseudomonas syringae]|uniref:DUF3800 domain-containing protein n=1 Tax=Pseudomonas syringae TaxID=317 RepID=UPI000CD140EF|nr:DUF3800 domain-containing protein [Pseudomonas syringae]MCH5522381.1 DUF3800 domain-containing protein [Pseudomonas syringae pv. lapsa]POD50356.1 RlfA protein [Pseudomonas syringae pv. syringae]
MKTEAFDPDFKIFCDESCHLEHDGINLMVLGALCCDASQVDALNSQIKALRAKHCYNTEIKWTKLIKKQMPFYHELIDLFIDGALNYKATVVQNKSNLNHNQFNGGSHGTFYYKMFFYALKSFLTADKSYRIYMDYMDTLSSSKAAVLTDVLQSNMHGRITLGTHIIRSHESQLIQLCDLLTGAIGYKNRSDIKKQSSVKNEIIRYLEGRIARSLSFATPPWEEKLNIFMFSPRSTNV